MFVRTITERLGTTTHTRRRPVLYRVRSFLSSCVLFVLCSPLATVTFVSSPHGRTLAAPLGRSPPRPFLRQCPHGRSSAHPKAAPSFTSASGENSVFVCVFFCLPFLFFLPLFLFFLSFFFFCSVGRVTRRVLLFRPNLAHPPRPLAASPLPPRPLRACTTRACSAFLSRTTRAPHPSTITTRRMPWTAFRLPPVSAAISARHPSTITTSTTLLNLSR